MKLQHINTTQLCESILKQLFLQLPSPSALVRQLPQMVKALAHRVTQTGLVVSALEVTSNHRYTAGVIFLLVLAPISAIFYQLFDPAVLVSNWYYVNNYYFFYTLSPYIMLLFASIGIFLLFPQKCKTSFMATVWPAGYACAKIFHYSFLVHSNAEFHMSTPLYVIITGFFIGLGFIASANYFLYRKYHLRDGTMARILGIIRLKGITNTEKIKHLETLAAEMENFNQRF